MTDHANPSVSVTGGSMPLLGFGTWQIPDADAPAAVGSALEAGYRHIDTATGYSNQRGVGKAIADSGSTAPTCSSPRSCRRTTPTAYARPSRRALDQLGLDHLDLWLVHWPPNGEARPDVWEQVVQAQADGLTKAVGVSNYSLDQIDELIQATGTTPAVNQIKWSPAEYDRAIAEGLSERGVVLEGYSPFKASNLQDPTLVAIADEHDADTAQVIVAWHVAHEFVVTRSLEPGPHRVERQGRPPRADRRRGREDRRPRSLTDAGPRLSGRLTPNGQPARPTTAGDVTPAGSGCRRPSGRRRTARRRRSSSRTARPSSAASARTFSSMVSSAMNRCTVTDRVCPMRCVPVDGLGLAAGFHHGSSTNTVSASVRVSQPAGLERDEERGSGALPEALDDVGPTPGGAVQVLVATPAGVERVGHHPEERRELAEHQGTAALGGELFELVEQQGRASPRQRHRPAPRTRPSPPAPARARASAAASAIGTRSSGSAPGRRSGRAP